MARQANRVLICDSDAFTTMLYRRLYFGDCPDYVRAEAERERYDLYLLTTPDTPAHDGAPASHPEQRSWFFERSVEWLTRRAANYVDRQRVVGRALRGGHHGHRRAPGGQSDPLTRRALGAGSRLRRVPDNHGGH